MLRIAGSITRIVCGACLLAWACLSFAQAAPPATKAGAAAKKAPHHAKHKGLSKEKPHTQHVTNGKCRDQMTHGNPANYESVQCPSNCQTGTAGQPKEFLIEIDDYVKSQQENAPYCLRAGDTAVWESASGLNFKIKDITSNGQQGHPFMGKVQKSYDSHAAADNHTQTDALKVRNSAIPDDGCYLFHPKVEVDKGGGDIKCYDPHIYTDCFDTCDASAFAAVKAPRSKATVARKAKPAGLQPETPAGR